MGMLTPEQWDEFLADHPNCHILQTRTWGEFKSRFGWIPYHIKVGDAGAQVLIRKLALGFSIAYLPKGPVGSHWIPLIEEINNLCRSEKSIVLYVEPDCWEEEETHCINQLDNYLLADIAIQPRRTILISLEGDEGEWLARMKQKTRYNIRLAERKGVKVAKSEDIYVFNQMIKVTGERDEFGIHEPEYYEQVFKLFSREEMCNLLVAEYDNKPQAALIVFYHGNRAWYFYGASNNQERNRMPTYLLQWEAMRLAAERGCKTYDLWGIPDESSEVLENYFTKRSDGLWGVYRFKRGFGGVIKRSAGVFEKINYPVLHRFFKTALRLRKGGLG